MPRPSPWSHIRQEPNGQIPSILARRCWATAFFIQTLLKEYLLEDFSGIFAKMEETRCADNVIKDDDDDDNFLDTMHLTRDIPVPPNSPVLEPEDPDNISILLNEEMGGEKLSTEEKGIALEPTDVSGVAKENLRKRKRLLDEEISSQTVCKEELSSEDTSNFLENVSPKQRLMKTKKKGKFLSTATHDLVYNELKKLFTKRGTSEQKEPGREEEGTCHVVETSVLEETNPQEELKQPQTGGAVTQESMDSIVEDKNTLQSEASSSTGKQSFSLAEFCKNSDRRQTASAFYSLLLLKKEQAIEVTQNAPYEDITVTEGPKFHDV
ncbi:double-strand-break repair protein rad21-like protein 1 [Dipodomys merriami]|uniref:double-strand-break repair protein rad21-like protein 1 n=1 Tax=Dipodomys merriami TaxID=94247 RepID=UPI003855D266